jgi:hypothetical protein
MVDAVPLALCRAQLIASEPPPTVLARTISVGGDTDTIASIAVQLAGTVVGCTGVPHDLTTNISGGDELRRPPRILQSSSRKGVKKSIHIDMTALQRASHSCRETPLRTTNCPKSPVRGNAAMIHKVPFCVPTSGLHTQMELVARQGRVTTAGSNRQGQSRPTLWRVEVN